MITINEIQMKLADAIKQSGLSQAEIARRLNVNPTQICSYLKGRKMPALDTFANLCAILDLDTDDILCVSEYKKNKLVK